MQYHERLLDFIGISLNQAAQDFVKNLACAVYQTLISFEIQHIFAITIDNDLEDVKGPRLVTSLETLYPDNSPDIYAIYSISSSLKSITTQFLFNVGASSWFPQV